MRSIRLIARLDIKAPNLIKGVQLEGLRVLGRPNEFAIRYYDHGIDELLYMDSVASLYQRNSLTALIEDCARNVFVPLAVGGGIRSVNDARAALASGADKIAINTAAIKRPELISELSRRFGSQAVVLSIEAKRSRAHAWEAYTDNGREHSGLDVVEWAKVGAGLGAGEILLTSVDREGTRKGFDVNLIKAVTDNVNIPVIASGGMGTMSHLLEVVRFGRADAVAIADFLHFGRGGIDDLRRELTAAGFASRGAL